MYDRLAIYPDNETRRYCLKIMPMWHLNTSLETAAHVR